MHLSVALGVAAATAALTGALLVGDSMRGSLREAAVERLGRIAHAVVAPRFFREALANEIGSGEAGAESAPVLLLRGSATHAGTQARAGKVNVLGVDARFWALQANDRALDLAAPQGRDIVLNDVLAHELGAVAGDDVLLRLGKPSAVSTETLLGRRDDTTLALRLTVRQVIPAEGLGAFGLEPRQSAAANAYVPLSTLQRTLDQAERVNAILFADENGHTERIRRHVSLADLGLRLRVDEAHGYIALESDSFLLEPQFEAAATEAADTLGLASGRVLTYLANSIELLPSNKTSAPEPNSVLSPQSSALVSQSSALIPYSTVSAVDAAAAGELLGDADLAPGGIVLNDWAADDLGAKPGDRLRLTYYVTGPFGQLETEHADFVLRAVVQLDGPAADPGLTPIYPGVTDTKRISDWDPPFPVDLTKVRDRDETFWDEHRATPKAFVTLQDGVKLWAHEAERLGRLTSIRVLPGAQANFAGAAAAFERELLQRIDLASAGLAVEPVRERAIAASQGNTDFGMLFIGFSFFLIVAALLFVALLFRLGAERRAREIGLMLATGFSPRRAAALFAAEGAIVAVAGVIAGTAGALGYGDLMLAGLRSWWSAAVSAPFLRLHVSGGTLAAGAVAALLAAVGSILWAIRGLTRFSPRALLAGSTQRGGRRRAGRKAGYTAAAALVAALALTILAMATDRVPQPILFFAAGAAMLVACVAAVAWLLGLPARTVIGESGGRSLTRLAARNAPRHRGRSLLTMALVASSAFVILALEAFRLNADFDPRDRRSGTGGFTLIAESAAPLHYDLNSESGRESLNMPSAASPALAASAIVPLRLRTGEETSCLNLYRSTQPRILGATRRLIERGGFTFAGTLAESQSERENPWTLLERRLEDGAVPAIGDEAAVKWQLHSGLGRDLLIEDESGREVRLRFVALLGGSMLQSELIVSETAFRRLFPSVEGYAFFLIDAPADAVTAVEQTLERELAPFGFDVRSARDRLAAYLAVQNTYLSTFQTLGGLGLVLGMAGLAAVQLRSVWERRRELALMQAVGFSRTALGRLVLTENLLLVAIGLAAGIVSAALAVAPHLLTRARDVPWASMLGLILAVLVAGLIAGVAALARALRAPLLPALRSE